MEPPEVHTVCLGVGSLDETSRGWRQILFLLLFFAAFVLPVTHFSCVYIYINIYIYIYIRVCVGWGREIEVSCEKNFSARN